MLLPFYINRTGLTKYIQKNNHDLNKCHKNNIINNITSNILIFFALPQSLYLYHPIQMLNVKQSYQQLYF